MAAYDLATVAARRMPRSCAMLMRRRGLDVTV